MIRYAPYIDGTIPAFDNTKIIVPFTPNKAVGEGAAAGMVLKIKEMNGNAINYIDTTDIQNNIAYFNLTTEHSFTIGQYYKVQLAYYDNTSYIKDKDGNYTTELDYASLTYSSIGITKYIGDTSIAITETSINKIKYEYVSQDLTEKLYNYNLEIRAGETLVRTIIGYHNNNSTITISPPLLKGIVYDYSLKATTINKYEMSVDDEIFQNNSIPTDSFIAECDSEYGEVKILQDKNAPPKLIRYTNSDLDGVILSNPDNTGEHGVVYRYGLIDDNDRTPYDDSIEKMCVFEDMFLQDATHILRIKFNPKVSNFKTTIQESKQDTLGSRYPYFFRNGDSYYNEFPISGLVSYLMQDNEKFMNDTQLGLVENSGERSNTNSTGTIEDKVRTTNLTDYNIAAERKFKMEVLKWLNNGEPKLFRSPTEGNYIVRLMNVSLSPEDRLGRMLHTFNATAYECAAATPEELSRLGLMRTKGE